MAPHVYRQFSTAHRAWLDNDTAERIERPDGTMDAFMIVCPNCGAVGRVTCEEPGGSGWRPVVIKLSKEFYRRVNFNGGLETLCGRCQTVVEFHGTASWLRRACAVIGLRK